MEPPNKSDGAYYIVCIKDKWSVRAFRQDQYGDIGHMKIWEEYLAPHLVGIFKLNRADEFLLKMSYAGFPRGRMVKIGMKYIVYHGNDYTHLVDKSDILKPFGISSARFEFDEHERAILEHRDTIRQLLKIERTWPAVR